MKDIPDYTGTPAEFLSLFPRAAKPRGDSGLSCVVDSGLATGQLADLLDGAGPYLDFVKFGWGTAVVAPNLEPKIELLQDNDICYWFGGTLFEIAFAQGRWRELAAWARDTGTAYFEVSDGCIDFEPGEKCRVIEQLSSDFKVLSEVGRKDAETILSPAKWVAAIRDELQAGAWKVVAEGRESGTAGIYRSNGEPRYGLVQEILEAGITPADMIFEAPKRAQQLWLLETVGLDVNLANIAPGDLLNLETYRRGLRADMMALPARLAAIDATAKPTAG